MNKEKVRRIKEAMKAKGLYRRPSYTVKELEDIAKVAKVDMFDVMYVARFC